VSERTTTTLHHSPLVAAYDVRCRAPRSGYGGPELAGTGQIILPRRGVFILQRGTASVVVDTTTAILLGANDEYRVSHPASCGDDCTVLVVSPELLEESVGSVAGRSASLQARDHFAVCLVTQALRGGSGDRLEADEAALLLLAALSPAFAEDGRANRQIGPTQTARVERVAELLASSLTARWDLRAVAQAVHCSPFHLARQFRMATGETIARRLLRLRLGLAVERLAEGERNLAGLALETGFANHSHFSARFRAVFGMTPTAARETLTRRKLDDLRALVGARAGHRAGRD